MGLVVLQAASGLAAAGARAANATSGQRQPATQRPYCPQTYTGRRLLHKQVLASASLSASAPGSEQPYHIAPSEHCRRALPPAALQHRGPLQLAANMAPVTRAMAVALLQSAGSGGGSPSPQQPAQLVHADSLADLQQQFFVSVNASVDLTDKDWVQVRVLACWLAQTTLRVLVRAGGLNSPPPNPCAHFFRSPALHCSRLTLWT